VTIGDLSGGVEAMKRPIKRSYTNKESKKGPQRTKEAIDTANYIPDLMIL
jgi:hypothetical protein